MNDGPSKGRVVGTGIVAGILILAAAETRAQAVSATGEAAAPLTVREIVDFRSLPSRTPVRVSPDGRRVAYTVEGPERTLGSALDLADPSSPVWTRIRVADLRSGGIVEIGEGSSAWAPSWSPDGSTLAFHSNRDGSPGVWLWDPASGTSRRASREVIWTAWTRNVPRWTPDGRCLIVKLLPEDRELSETLRRAVPAAPLPVVDGAATVRVFRSDADQPGGTGFTGWLTWRHGGDLAAVDVESGAVTRLTIDAIPVWWDVSPDGSLVALSELTNVDGGDAAYRLAVVPVDGGRKRDLPGDVRQTWGEAVSWSPADPALAYVSGHGGDAAVFVVDVREGARRRVADARSGWAESTGPVWTPDGRALLFTDGAVWRVPVGSRDPTLVTDPPDHAVLQILSSRGTDTVAASSAGDWVVRVAHRHTDETGFARLDPMTGDLDAIALEHGRFGSVYGVDVTADASTIVATFSATRHAPELWLLDDGLRRDRRVSALNPAFRAADLGEARLIRWTTEEGRALEGTLLLPPGHRDGRRAPLVVEVYGGRSGAAALHEFDRHRQLLATHGYAVLVPDVPLEVGSPMRGHAQAVVPAVDRAIELGLADPERVGVTGNSYGGYGALSLLVQTDRFAAAVASASHGNMAGMFGRLAPDGSSTPRWTEVGQGRMGVPPWEEPIRYLENSPVFYLDGVEAPLLLLHGTEDRNTPAYLAGEVFTGLRHLGRTVALTLYEGEGHSPLAWSVPNQIDYWTRFLGWFEEHLRDPRIED